MKRWALVALAALAIFGACKKKDPPLPQHGDDFGAANTYRVFVNDMKTFGGDAGPDESPTESHALVGLPGAAIEIWTHRVVGRTEILARRLDADGAPAGPTGIVDGFEGTVPWLTATRSGANVWIAWIVSTKGGRTAHLGFVEGKGTTAAHVLKVPIEGDDDATAAGSLRLAPRAGDGGSTTVAFAAVTARTPAPCADADAGNACHRGKWAIFGTPALDHAFAPIADGGIDGGPGVNVDALVDLGGAIFASTSAWNDGPAVDFALAPLPVKSGGALPDVHAIVPAPPPRPPFSVAFTGDALVFRAPSQPWPEKNGKCPRPSFEQGLCEQVAIVPVANALRDPRRPDGGGPSTSASAPAAAGDAGPPATAWLPLTAVHELCEGGALTIELVHPNGSVRLADKPGAYVPELQGWTGKALLALDENGRVTKRACEGGKLSTLAR